jgi:hypothetical protein
VPTLVQLELAKWLTREVGEDRAALVIAFTQVCRVVPLDTAIALAAAEACRAHRLARRTPSSSRRPARTGPCCSPPTTISTAFPA